MLIFGKNPQRRLPQSSIIFAVFNGNDTATADVPCFIYASALIKINHKDLWTLNINAP